MIVMDVLDAIRNPPDPPASSTKPPLYRSSTSFGSVQYDDLLPTPGSSYNLSGASMLNAIISQNFSVPTPPASDGSWMEYTDFVGPSALQHWGFALCSGTFDGAIRMWDIRTGQAHRTLVAGNAPITTLSFDENVIMSGSLDKTLKVSCSL